MDRTLRIKAISHAAETATETVRGYAREGLLDCELDSNGQLLFSQRAIEQVRAIKAERLARRGRRRNA